MGIRTDRGLQQLSLVAFGLVVVMNVAYLLVLRGVDDQPQLTYPLAPDVSDALGSVATVAVGTALVWLRPRNPIGWLISVSGVSLATCMLLQAYGARALVLDDRLPAGALAAALGAGLWIPSVFIPATVVLLRYPTGALAGRWPRRFERVAVLGFAGGALGYSVSPQGVQDVVKNGESVITLPEWVGGSIFAAGLLLCFLATLLAAGDAVRRIRRGDGKERGALLLLLAAALAAVLVIMFGPDERLGSLAYFSIMVAIAVGVVRHGALGIEVTLLTGDRHDPFATLNRLGVPMGEAVDGRSLPDVLTRLREALGVEGVGIEGEFTAVVGTLPPDPVEVPLAFAGRELGVLSLGHRNGRARLTAADRRIAEAMAPLLAAVLHAVRLAEELREEKVRAVAATQAERGRLRQELHDGLGPALTGIGLGLDALAPNVSEKQSPMVARLRSEVASSLDETRRIIDDLRPGALDGADLATALRRRAERVRDAGTLALEVSAPQALPGLPPTVATAAFRIAEEAIANVVRHAHASSAEVHLVLVGDVLVLEITDDGIGYTGPREGGVGVGSMEERATRLGGRLSITSAGSGLGTRVRAELPLRSA
ncbi:MAG TPA: GAF domain-containing sensor histidine kinase [Nocardioidaceae bacterium]|nr:GAF domain-containing sensor histidine kinase [Nocardioidaceae bacterium]